MKYLKKYEDINNGSSNNEPKVNDYVILKSYSHLGDFFKNNIGQIEAICPDIDSDKLVYIIYFENENIPVSTLWYFDNLESINKFLNKVNHELLPITYKKFFYVSYKEDIKYFSSNKQDLEAIIYSEKYNL